MSPVWWLTCSVLLGLIKVQVFGQYSGWYGQQQTPCYGSPVVIRQDSDDDGLRSILPLLLLLLTDTNGGRLGGRFTGGCNCDGCCGCGSGGGCSNGCSSGCNCEVGSGCNNGGGTIPIPYPIPIPVNCPIIT